MQRVRRLVMLVVRLTRWARSQARLLELLCCLEEAARKRRLVRLVSRRVKQEHRRWRRVQQLGQPCSEVVDQQRMWVQLQLRWPVLVVQVLRRLRLLQERQQVLLWWLMVGRYRRQLKQRVRRPRVQERLWSRQRRSQVRQRQWRWCMVEEVSRQQWLQLGKLCVKQEDRHVLRRRPQWQQSRRRTQGIVDTTRVASMMQRRAVVAGALWCTMRRVWVRPRLQQEARRAMLVRRLADKRFEVEQVRWTLPRQRVWLQVLLW